VISSGSWDETCALDSALCDKVGQWLAEDNWLSASTPVTLACLTVIECEAVAPVMVILTFRGNADVMYYKQTMQTKYKIK
jgi:hypothetical protein